MYTVDNPIFKAVYVSVQGDVNLTQHILSMIVGVEEHTDKLDFVLALSEAKKFDQHAEWEAEHLARLEENTKRVYAEHIRDEKVVDWVLKNVDSGMIVKMTGTRDKGYRRVIKRYSDSSGIYLECRQLEITVPIGCRLPTSDQLKDRPYITTHLLKKMTAVLIGGEWRKVVDLVKEERDD